MQSFYNTKPMKLGFRIPSLTKRIAAHTSIKRVIRHNLGLKAPKGLGILTDPQKAMYNKVYNKTSKGCLVVILCFFGSQSIIAFFIWKMLIG
jgi:hypothetical protein